MEAHKRLLFLRIRSLQYQSCSFFLQEIWFCVQKSKKKKSRVLLEMKRDKEIAQFRSLKQKSKTFGDVMNLCSLHSTAICCIWVRFNFVVFCDIGYGPVIEMLWNTWYSVYIYTVRVCNQFKCIKDNYYLQARQASVFISLLFSELWRVSVPFKVDEIDINELWICYSFMSLVI